MAVRSKVTKNKIPPMLQRYEILDRINKLENLRDRALISFLYLSGARIEEVVKYKVEQEYVGEPIQKKQIEFSDDHILIRNIRSLKRRSYMPRTVPIFRNEIEKPFIDILTEYLATLQPDDFLFNFTRQRAFQICDSIGLYNHWLRHLRDSHLVIDYNFSGIDLKQFNNWSSSAMSDTYVHLNVTNLLDKMRKKN